MRISTKGRYGMRAVIILALHHRESPVSAEYISEREKIPLDYLEQLFVHLRKCGLVKSARGPGGGFFLAKSPSKIKAGDVMRCVKESMTLEPCVVGCNRDKRCVAQIFFKRISKGIEEMMDSISLEDLIQKRRLENGRNV